MRLRLGVVVLPLIGAGGKHDLYSPSLLRPGPLGGVRGPRVRAGLTPSLNACPATNGDLWGRFLMAGKITIKVPALTRDEVRAMDRAAKTHNPPISRSAWARHVLVGASSGATPPPLTGGQITKVSDHSRGDVQAVTGRNPVLDTLRGAVQPLPPVHFDGKVDYVERSKGVKPCRLCGGREVHKPACPNRPDFKLGFEADMPVRQDD